MDTVCVHLGRVAAFRNNEYGEMTTYTVEDGIERQVFPEVAHPARRARVAQHLLLHDVLHPLHS